jgi:hypothetical protein
MESYDNIVKQFRQLNTTIDTHPDRDTIISRLIDDGYFEMYGLIPNIPSEQCPEKPQENTDTPNESESDDDDDDDDDDDAKDDETKCEMKHLDFDPATVETAINNHHKEKQEELMSTILVGFLQSLVEYEETLTSSAFLHRCYLAYAKKEHHTNAKPNVIKSVDVFKKVVRDLLGNYEVIQDGRSKGWKLAIPSH